MLTVDSTLWPLPLDPVTNPLGTRPDIEIYNMPLLSPVFPPSRPRQGIAVGYTYVSGIPASGGTVFPLTPDRQPMLLLAKKQVADSNYSRALCGFEPWRLTLASHVALARWVLVRHMGVGVP